MTAMSAKTPPREADIDNVFDIDPSVVARRRENRTVQISRLLLCVFVLGAWELASDRVMSAFWISSPSGVFNAFVQLIGSGQLLKAMWSTMLVVTAGFVLGTAIGVFLGVALGVNRTIARVLDPFLIGLYSLPRVALVPLFIIWFGIGFQMKVVFTALLVFFPIFMNTISGIKSVDHDLIDVIRVMGASRWDTVRRVLIPSALSWVFAGLRISVPFALIGAVVAEMFSSNQGLGYLISRTANQFDTGGLFAALIATTVLGLILDVAVHASERYLMPWRAGQH